MKKKEPLPTALLEHVAQTFRVLGDSSRLEILQALMTGPKAVGGIIELTGKGQANVSKHLGILAGAALVNRTRQGTRVIYEIADPLVFSLCDLVCDSVRNRLAGEVKANTEILRNA
jgi:DNA-binding transcriptional ArsR family regulator